MGIVVATWNMQDVEIEFNVRALYQGFLFENVCEARKTTKISATQYRVHDAKSKIKIAASRYL